MDLHEIEDLLQNQTGMNADMIEALAEYAGIGLFNLHIQTGEIRLNRAIAQLAGYEPGELPHNENTKDMLTFEGDKEMVNRHMEAVMRGEINRYSIEYRMRRRDGSIVAVEENCIVCERDKSGTPTRLAALTVDLSRLRWAENKARDMERENQRLAKKSTDSELAEQNRMLRAANNAAAIIIGGFHQDYETVLRQSLQILAESVQADRAYIWRNVERDGRQCYFLRAVWDKNASATVFGPEDAEPYDDIFENWKVEFNDRFSIRARANERPASLKNLQGLPESQSILLAPLYLDGEFWGLLGFSDESEDRVFSEDEAEIMVSGARVVASSISRNETFGKLNEAREEAMASTRAKGEFLSRMSHEIRTPMNAIIGMTTIAKKTDDPERIRYCLEKVDVSSRQLLSLINDVLDMSKIDSGKFEIVNGEFNFENMMQNVLNVIDVKVEEKHQDLKVNFDSVFTRAIVSDELRLSQVLINLLSNAIKFTPEGGEIVLTVTPEKLEGGSSRLHVEVRDAGIGILPEQQERLFHSFEQADGSITRSYGGTGLGLSICKKIVNLMGGEIWVESEPGKGSNFIFEVEIGWGEKLLPSSTIKKVSEKMRVLVVDDAEDVREYFKNILGSFSLPCDTAESGMAAIEEVKRSLAQGTPYNMIFIDWNMPGMNGVDTAAKIRKIMGEDVAIVLISVADRADIKLDADGEDVNYFLSKPVLPSVLYNTIVKLSDNALVTEKTTEDGIDWTGRTILLAEDVEINREIVFGILIETGVEIVPAEDGVEALEYFAASPDRFDLILMDVQMPNMDGLTATRRIREMDNDWAKRIPILAMTANAFKEDEQLSLDAGMNGHIAKPIDVDALFRTLSKYFDEA